ncbi:Gfo/Idh/MocA family oxidoreductase [Thalassococcus sp. CAU 1522]|uniref:Gfo/Idh/MocA family oxidoreductase n=1 Tax=Thalassococcus arenae TaxID=2851652 RepID=A0ABS6N3R0_9RHOB|nr:Gfo/Idh/MocA family oxidoreductase [Thalassococcus arenae]
MRPSIAVFGAGLIGQAHIRRVTAQARLAAIVDPAPAARALANEHGAPWFPDPESYLSGHRPDGAIIATPNRLHEAHGLACAASGIPMLVEKPITADTAGAARLVDAAEKAGVPLLVGHHRRHNPLIDAARAAIASGRLGDIVAVTAQFWLYKPDVYFEQGWRRMPGAGPVFINLIHDVDLLRFLCGEVSQVMAIESNATRGFDVEDTTAILMRFVNGALGTVTASDTIVAPWSWEFTAGENPAYPHVPIQAYKIGGTDASLSIPDLTLWRHTTMKGWWEPMVSETLPYAAADPLDRQMAHFVDVIAGRAVPLVSGREALRTLALVEAIKHAAETGVVQPLNPG